MTKEQTDEYKLDKNHVFKVTKFDDFEKYSKVPDQYTPAEKKPYQPKVRVFPSQDNISSSSQLWTDCASLWAGV